MGAAGFRVAIQLVNLPDKKGTAQKPWNQVSSDNTFVNGVFFFFLFESFIHYAILVKILDYFVYWFLLYLNYQIDLVILKTTKWTLYPLLACLLKKF